jgi:hypothetical protein
VATHDPNDERQGYNRSDPRMPFCPEDPRVGAHKFDAVDYEQRLTGPHACELRELEVTRGIARRLRAELIYGMPASTRGSSTDVHGLHLRDSHRQERLEDRVTLRSKIATWQMQTEDADTTLRWSFKRTAE